MGQEHRQHVIPDENSLALWKGAVGIYKNHPAVLFDLYNEPHGASWDAWIRSVLQALHDHKWDWVAWDLHPAAGPTLIPDWNYTPTPHFGAYVKQKLIGTLQAYMPVRSAPNMAPVGTTPAPSPASSTGRATRNLLCR